MKHLARNTLIPGILTLAESYGVRRDEVLDEIGLDPAMAQGVGTVIPSVAIVDATECAALKSGRNDFGLQLGDRQDHRLIGPLGLLLEQASSIEEFLAFSRRYFHLHNTSLRYTLTKRRDRSGVIELRILARGAFEPRHYVEALFVICVRMAQIVLGAKWRPLAVQFKHKRQAGRASYERHFGQDVLFEQSRNAILCRAADLEHKAAPRDPELRRRLEVMLNDLNAKFANDTVGKASHLIRALLPGGQASIGHVAKLMALTPRTLQRRLHARRMRYCDVLAATRVEMARDYTRAGLKITDMAPILGFSEASALSRFLREHGRSVRELRRRRSRKIGRSVSKRSNLGT